MYDIKTQNKQLWMSFDPFWSIFFLYFHLYVWKSSTKLCNHKHLTQTPQVVMGATPPAENDIKRIFGMNITEKKFEKISPESSLMAWHRIL